MEAAVAVLRELGRATSAANEQYDFGFLSSFAEEQFDRVIAEVQGTRSKGNEEFVRMLAHLFQDWPHEPWNRQQSFVRGVAMGLLTQRFRGNMAVDDVPRALAAIVSYQCQQDIIDDLIDHGSYSFPEAWALCRRCLGASTDPEFDPDTFADEVFVMVSPDLRPLSELLVWNSARLNELLRAAPNPGNVLPRLAQVNEEVSFAQAATTFLRSPFRDPGMLKKMASTMWAPHTDATWYDRLAGHASWAAGVYFVNACFARNHPSAEQLDAERKAWFCYDVVITYLDHLATVEEDFQDRITNVALLAMYGTRVRSVLSAPKLPELTEWDYGGLLARAAEFSCRAATWGMAAKPGDFYPLVSTSVGIALLSVRKRDGGAMMERYLLRLSDRLRDLIMRRRTWEPATAM
ncbi:MAG: hypothetical protein HY557_04095 [Euryarchaeota archaeon]|nr:hypothetical protein [Euryarchaeota archaeon]